MNSIDSLKGCPIRESSDLKSFPPPRVRFKTTKSGRYLIIKSCVVQFGGTVAKKSFPLKFFLGSETLDFFFFFFFYFFFFFFQIGTFDMLALHKNLCPIAYGSQTNGFYRVKCKIFGNPPPNISPPTKKCEIQLQSIGSYHLVYLKYQSKKSYSACSFQNYKIGSLFNNQIMCCVIWGHGRKKIIPPQIFPRE
eukprot:TRINITY_DN3060_c0_g2_i1.p2 TRINITY_DN3060_c0_g2~~TRINITY_DN3060_c0_g2_i1.p2  ORF type:complete len:193 (+),score=18.68 TRINITY_DN3060_c0_g2_i1:1-579(+)